MQHMAHARQQQADASDEECCPYMEEEDNAVLDQSVDYSLDSDINTSLPENTPPLDNLLVDSSFPDMAMDVPEIDFGIQDHNNDNDDGEDVHDGEDGHGSEAAENELDAASVRSGSERSDGEATNMTDQLSFLLNESAADALDLSTVKQETSAAERDESAEEKDASSTAEHQNDDDDSALEQDADPATNMTDQLSLLLSENAEQEQGPNESAALDLSTVEPETNAVERDESAAKKEASSTAEHQNDDDSSALEQDADPVEQDVSNADLQDATGLAQDIIISTVDDQEQAITSHQEKKDDEDGMYLEQTASATEEHAIEPEEQEMKLKLVVSGITHFLDNGQPLASPAASALASPASADMSVTSDATFRLGRQMGKF
jgi:hypothetical protein